MEVRKDGSVFRIELDSDGSGFETRISFAVNTHGEMRRPRLEVSQKGLVRLFTETLRHITGEAMVGDGDDNQSIQSVESRRISVEELFRLVDQVVMFYTTDRRAPHRPTLGKVAWQIEVLAALQQEKYINANPAWGHLIVAVNVLMKWLAHKPQSLKSGYLSSPSGILSAYREGDLMFTEAVAALEEWKAR